MTLCASTSATPLKTEAMSEKSIIKMSHTFENNGLIADFMGKPRHQEYKSHFRVDNEDGSVGMIHAEEFKYHTSWDWLMPVVERINLTADEWGNTNDLTIGNGYVWVDPHIGDRIFFSGNNPEDKEEPMISKVYRGVLAFINSDC
jgi:hypothetical protein